MKGRVYARCVRSIITYGSETRPLLVDVGLKFERAGMQMIRWMGGISLKDRKTNEELRRLVGVEPITTFIRGGRLRWYGHVMRKGDEDWVKNCMEYRAECRIPVGRPTKTWLESVEADMTEPKIDKEDVHDRRKSGRNVIKRKPNPIGKKTINDTIYIKITYNRLRCVNIHIYLSYLIIIYERVPYIQIYDGWTVLIWLLIYMYSGLFVGTAML